VVTAINLDRWNSLSATQQEALQAAVTAGLEDKAWETAADALANDIACLTGNGTCASGEARSMTLVEASAEDVARARDILVTEVLPDWAGRAGNDRAGRWNDSVGAVTGVTVPLN
jgi:TRAP-type C4-dicarboxylate transport system substrate-binding protein